MTIEDIIANAYEKAKHGGSTEQRERIYLDMMDDLNDITPITVRTFHQYSEDFINGDTLKACMDLEAQLK